MTIAPTTSRFKYPAIFNHGIDTYAIPGSTDTIAHLALWNGNEFEVLSPSYIKGSSYTQFEIRYYPHEYIMTLYYPIDPRITVDDVRGATSAYANDDNTGWLFQHCTETYHLDKELELVAVVESLFQGAVESRLWDYLSPRVQTSAGLKTRALTKYETIKTFRDKVQAQVRKGMSGAYLGYFHQNPNVSHVSGRIKYALDIVKQEYAAAGTLATILAEYNEISKALNATHTHETRWDQVARLKAEEKASQSQDQEG